MTTNNNTKSYQTTLAQDPEVLAKPKDQILHWSRTRVAVEFPPLRLPAKIPCFGSENKTINEILTEFQDSEKHMKLKKIKDQKKCVREIWDLPANSLARDFPFQDRLLWKRSFAGPPSWVNWTDLESVRTFIEAFSPPTTVNQSPSRYVMISLLIGHCEWSEPLTWYSHVKKTGLWIHRKLNFSEFVHV